jgi:hypothetical protein
VSLKGKVGGILRRFRPATCFASGTVFAWL